MRRFQFKNRRDLALLFLKIGKHHGVKVFPLPFICYEYDEETIFQAPMIPHGIDTLEDLADADTHFTEWMNE